MAQDSWAAEADRLESNMGNFNISTSTGKQPSGSVFASTGKFAGGFGSFGAGGSAGQSAPPGFSGPKRGSGAGGDAVHSRGGFSSPGFVTDKSSTNSQQQHSAASSGFPSKYNESSWNKTADTNSSWPGASTWEPVAVPSPPTRPKHTTGNGEASSDNGENSFGTFEQTKTNQSPMASPKLQTNSKALSPSPNSAQESTADTTAAESSVEDEDLEKADASYLNKILHSKLVECNNEVEVQRKNPNSPLYSVKSFEQLHLKPELLK